MRVFLIFCFLILPVLSFPLTLVAQTEQRISQRLDFLIKELDLAEKKQNEILTTQEKMIETIKSLKIVARR